MPEIIRPDSGESDMARRAGIIMAGMLLASLGACDSGSGATTEAAESPVAAELEAHFAKNPQPRERRFIVTRIEYAPGEYKLPREAEPVLTEVGRVIAAHPGAVVRLESYAKESGTDADLHLAAKRALYAGKALEQAGVPKRHVFAVSWDPVSSSDAAALGPLENGRTDVVLYTKEAFETPT